MERFVEHVLVTNGTFLFYTYFAIICKISFTVLNYSDTRLRIKFELTKKTLFEITFNFQKSASIRT